MTRRWSIALGLAVAACTDVRQIALSIDTTAGVPCDVDRVRIRATSSSVTFIRSVPLAPSRITRVPSAMSSARGSIPATAGMSRDRARIETCDDAPPAWVQSLAFGVLAPLGRALGRRPCYPEYLSSSTVVEPDPAALALLDESGRLRSTSH